MVRLVIWERGMTRPLMSRALATLAQLWQVKLIEIRPFLVGMRTPAASPKLINGYLTYVFSQAGFDRAG